METKDGPLTQLVKSLEKSRQAVAKDPQEEKYLASMRRASVMEQYGGVLHFPLARQDGMPLKSLDWLQVLLDEIPDTIRMDCGPELVLDIGKQQIELRRTSVLTFRELQHILLELRRLGEEI